MADESASFSFFVRIGHREVVILGNTLVLARPHLPKPGRDFVMWMPRSRLVRRIQPPARAVR